MLVTFLVTSLLFVKGQCLLQNPPHQNDHQPLIECIIGILNEYFYKINDITFVNIQNHEDVLLKAIHSTTNFTLISRFTTQQMFAPNIEYLVTSTNVTDFCKYFHYLIQEPAWNPNARFLIIIKSLQYDELKFIFDELLIQHVNNVLIVNGTEDAHLYTYNPFDNYACGRYYDIITKYGRCSQVTNNLYPNKLVTGLRNCSLRALIAHRPPFTIDPSKTKDKKKKETLLGLEEYVIRLLGKKEQFTVSFNYNTDQDQMSMVSPNMTATGALGMLQKNECDITFGALMMLGSRAEAFTYLTGYHDSSVEMVFLVKSASSVPAWKYIYLEFKLEVWILLLVALLVYTVLVLILLHSADVSGVFLRLFDNLLLHGRDIRTRTSVKYILITWVWFAYLINTFYQSILVSFVTHPITEYQISNELDINKYNLIPCFNRAFQTYIQFDNDIWDKSTVFRTEGCTTLIEAINTISKDKNLFTLIATYEYEYNIGNFSDKWGKPLVYVFDKPYTKYAFGFYFYKGFPLTESLQLNTLRIRESGLSSKWINEHFFRQRLKYHFSPQTFESFILLPWCVYIPGLMAALIAFFVEIMTK